MKNNDTTTLYISNGGYGAINKMITNKLKTGVYMKVCAIKSATAHILVRWRALEKKFPKKEKGMYF